MFDHADSSVSVCQSDLPISLFFCSASGAEPVPVIPRSHSRSKRGGIISCHSADIPSPCPAIHYAGLHWIVLSLLDHHAIQRESLKHIWSGVVTRLNTAAATSPTKANATARMWHRQRGKSARSCLGQITPGASPFWLPAHAATRDTYLGIPTCTFQWSSPRISLENVGVRGRRMGRRPAAGPKVKRARMALNGWLRRASPAARSSWLMLPAPAQAG